MLIASQKKEYGKKRGSKAGGFDGHKYK